MHGNTEELRCLQLLNRLQDLSELEDLASSQPCFKLALGIKDYVATVSPGKGGVRLLRGCLFQHSTILLFP